MPRKYVPSTWCGFSLQISFLWTSMTGSFVSSSVSSTSRVVIGHFSGELVSSIVTSLNWQQPSHVATNSVIRKVRTFIAFCIGKKHNTNFSKLNFLCKLHDSGYVPEVWHNAAMTKNALPTSHRLMLLHCSSNQPSNPPDINPADFFNCRILLLFNIYHQKINDSSHVYKGKRMQLKW